MFSAAIFDMDGLLIDSERATMNAWIGAAKHHGIDFHPSDYLPVIGQTAADSDWILMSRLGGQSAFHQVSERVSELLEMAPPDMRFPLKPGVLDLLSSLRTRGVPCAVASSSNLSDIRERLAAVGVLECFQALAGGDEVIKGKPDPAVYHLAAARLGMDPVRCLAFEDSENGALAASGAGSKVILVPDLNPPCAAIATRCFRILNSLHEALEHIPSWFASQGSA
ncbi:MAG TPA: HAD family phosphatase [Geothrix sp.]|jgi:HAD superfamily hydrolase (TIGR01509 family)